MSDVQPPGTPAEETGQDVILGRYRVEQMLGRGGFGDVVRAFDVRIRRHVAIKTLHRSLADDTATFQAAVARFEREAEAASRMGTHPNVVTVHDLAAAADGTLYLILEYVPGGTLAQRIERGPLPFAEALRITSDVAQGLHAAHETRIVHRDIKPANIFLTATGRAKIGDFGVAQMDHLSHRTQAATGHPGTPLYMSPEQQQSGAYVRPASDEYSLGLVLFEMVTGQAFRRLPLMRALSLLGAQPPEIRALIERMTAANEEMRYATLAEVAGAIEGILPLFETGSWNPNAAIFHSPAIPQWPSASGTAPTTPPGTPPGISPTTPPGARVGMPPMTPPGTPSGSPYWQMPRETPRINLMPAPLAPPATPPESPPTPHRYSRRAVLIGVGGLVVAGGAAGGIFAVTRGDGGTATVTPSSPTATPSPTTALATPTSAASTPGPATVVGAGITPTTSPPTATTAPATATNGPATVTPRPSGTAGTTVTASATTVTLDTPLRGLTGHTQGVQTVAWSPDGKMLASASYDKTNRLWRVSDGSMLRMFTGHTDVALTTAFSPDGQMLATGSNDKTIKLWDVATAKELRTLTGHSIAVLAVAFAPDGKTLASGSPDDTVRVWRVSDGVTLQTLKVNQFVYSVGFTKDGQTLAAGTHNGDVQLWRPSDGTLLRTLTSHSAAIWGLAFSPDGKMLATASGDATVRLWQVSDGTPLRTLQAHPDGALTVAFAPDGLTLATGGMDSMIALWQINDGRGDRIRTIKAHAGRVFSVAYSPDGTTLASGGNDTTIRLWKVS